MRFIDRDKELKEIRDLLLILRSGKSIQFPVREYVGIGGIGKSALLRTIGHECEGIPFPYVYLDIGTFQSKSAALWIWELLRALCLEVAYIFEKLGNTTLSSLAVDFLEVFKIPEEDQSDAQLPTQVQIDQILDLFAGFSCMMIFDGVERVPLASLEQFGQEIIFPLSDSGRILIILGTRSKLNWGAPKYKIWRRTKTTLLEPFSSEETQEQLSETSFQELSPEIQFVTNGHPASNDVVIKILNYIEKIEKTKVRREIFGDYESRLVDAVVDEVIRQRVVIPATLFRAFCVLSILRRFDVDVPVEFLARINGTTNWSEPLPVMDLIRTMLHDTNYVVSLDSERNSYQIDPFVRRALSLYMRFFFREEYFQLSKEALAHYDRKLAKSPTDVYSIIEKLYHLADIIRLSGTRKYDLSIALALRDQLKQDLINSIGVPYEAIQWDSRMTITDAEERRRAFDRLRKSLEEDSELHEKLGDIVEGDTTNFLVQALDEIQKDLLDTGKAILDIVKHHIPQQTTNQEPREEEYSIGFILSQRNVDITLSITIPQRRKAKLLRDAGQARTVDELEDIGKVIRNQFLPRRIQDLLKQHTGPLTISINDTAIPWELMHDGEEFIALRLPLGKRLRTAEDAKISRRTNTHHIRPLLVGVPVTDVPDFPPLQHVENEIRELKQYLQGIGDIAFNPSQDVIFGDDADAYEFLKRLSSGRYDIIHFAGHAYYDEYKKTGGLVLADTKLELEEIKRSVEGRPLVFLNACQSAVDETVEIQTGYVGSYTLGIASTFMLGGALACVGNIWKISDSSSASFAAHFYKEMLSGVMVGEALRRTKVHTRQMNPLETNWASYILFGDPTSRLFMR